MRTSIGGANVCVGGTASANNYQGTYLPSKAFDGLTTDTGLGNGWASVNTTGSDGIGSFNWLMYDFGAGNEKDIQEIVLFAPGTGGISGANMLPIAWRFQWSDDGVSWTTQRDYTFDALTPAWTYLSSRIYDVRQLGAIDIHNGKAMEVRGYRSPAPGQPTQPVYVPGGPESKITISIGRYKHDNVLGGQFKLSGSTTSLGFPAPRRVRLYEQRSGRNYGEVNTTADGLFEFRNIHQGPWVVIGLDDTGAQNGVIFSHILAVPM
jgi:hypothetical protein